MSEYSASPLDSPFHDFFGILLDKWALATAFVRTEIDYFLNINRNAMKLYPYIQVNVTNVLVKFAVQNNNLINISLFFTCANYLHSL